MFLKSILDSFRLARSIDSDRLLLDEAYRDAVAERMRGRAKTAHGPAEVKESTVSELPKAA